MANTAPTGRCVPQPSYIFRGHASTVQSLLFSHANSRLISGDADGWILIWDVAIRRPVAVWRAHESVVLGIQRWGADKLVTHGRDGKLSVWKMSTADTEDMDKTLPVEETTSHRKQPWLLHSLKTSNLTFCSFAMCVEASRPTHPDTEEVLVALPGEVDSTVEIYQLPSEKQIGVITAPAATTAGKTGMVMALRVFYHTCGQLLVIVGYESGRTCMFRRSVGAGQWELLYNARPHEQPILSLGVAPSLDFYITSGADAVVAKHLVAAHPPGTEPIKLVQTKHAGQQGLRVRSDGKIFATAGWDGRARVYSAKTLKELAVLKWHKEGCYTVAFALIDPDMLLDMNRTETEVAKATDSQLMQNVGQTRNLVAHSTHWLAVGSKDGKISLWEIY